MIGDDDHIDVRLGLARSRNHLSDHRINPLKRVMRLRRIWATLVLHMVKTCEIDGGKAGLFVGHQNFSKLAAIFIALNAFINAVGIGTNLGL